MRFILTLSFACLGLVGAHAAGNERREAKAHEHGHGKVNIAIEGKRVFVEVEAPGADIVGFEHAAKSDAEKAAVKAAKAAMQNAVGILELPAAAGCKLVTSTVELHGSGSEHNEFHAAYEFECQRIKSLNKIGLTYFKSFPNAREMEVAVISAKGQQKFEATAKQSSVPLGGLIQ